MAVPVTQESEFRIVSQAFDAWNVQFRIDVIELLDQEGLLRHLRRIKQQIARMYSLPETGMLFDGIVRKTRTRDYVDVIVRIKKVLFEKGNPRVHFKDGMGADRTVYVNMTALLDIFYLDQFEKPIMLDRVFQVLREAGIPTDLVDDGIVTRRVHEVLKSQIPIKNIPVAKGTLPDIGKDAVLDFYFQAVAEPGDTDQYFSSRRVSRGDMLCRKIPPTIGEHPGSNARGELLPPRSGLDIELKTGPGAMLSLDGFEAVADADGVAVASRTLQRVKMIGETKELPQSILIKVNPVLRVEGDRVLDISSSQTVEVIGNLTMGSRILTDCELYVSGDVEQDTHIQAADDVMVEGQIHGATVHSDSNVIAQKNVTDSEVIAKDRIIVKGSVRNCDLVADSVAADSVSGSRIVSQKNVIVERIDADENHILSTICVGMFEFFKQRIRENEIFLERAAENLTRIEMLIGQEIMTQINAGNAQTMVMRFLSAHRMCQDLHARKQVAVYRRLLESVPPTRSLIAQKEKENIELLKRIVDKEQSGEHVIVVREKMAAKALFSVDGVEAEVNPLDSPATVSADTEGNLIIDRPGEGETPAPGDQTQDESAP